MKRALLISNLLLLLVQISCRTTNDIKNIDRIQFSTSTEVWLFFGRLKDTEKERDFGYYMTFIHTYDSVNNNHWITSFISLSDFKEKIYYSDVFYNQISPDTSTSTLPLKCYSPDNTNAWKAFGSKGNYKIMATINKQPFIKLNINTKAIRSSMIITDLLVDDSVQNSLIIYSSLLTNGFIKFGKVKNKVDGHSYYCKINNADRILNKPAHKFLIISSISNSGIVLIANGTTLQNGELGRSDLFLSNTDGGFKKVNNYDLQIDQFWESQVTHVSFPIYWSINLPNNNLRMNISPEFCQQEMYLLKTPAWMGFAKTNIASGNDSTSGWAGMIIF
jgi:hypothetical protein